MEGNSEKEKGKKGGMDVGKGKMRGRNGREEEGGQGGRVGGREV